MHPNYNIWYHKRNVITTCSAWERFRKPSRICENLKTLPGLRIEQGCDGAASDVIHVGEITRLLAVAVHNHRPAFADPLYEAKQAHVRPPCWAVDGEVAQHGHAYAVQVMVGVAQCLRRLLGGCVGGKGAIGVGVFPKRSRIVGPVEAGSGGQNELLDLMFLAKLQQVQCAGDVGLELHPRILDGLADAGAGSQIHDSVEWRRGSRVLGG